MRDDVVLEKENLRKPGKLQMINSGSVARTVSPEWLTTVMKIRTAAALKHLEEQDPIYLWVLQAPLFQSAFSEE